MKSNNATIKSILTSFISGQIQCISRRLQTVTQNNAKLTVTKSQIEGYYQIGGMTLNDSCGQKGLMILIHESCIYIKNGIQAGDYIICVDARATSGKDEVLEEYKVYIAETDEKYNERSGKTTVRLEGSKYPWTTERFKNVDLSEVI